MSCLLWSLALATLLGAVPAEVETISSERLSGELVEFNDQGLTLKIGNETRVLPAAQVLEIRRAVPQIPLPPGPRIELVDGTRLSGKELTIARDRATLTLPSGVSVPLTANRFASIRLGESSPTLDDAWKSLLQRERKNDLLVVRKDDVLDFVPGVAGSLGEKVVFLVDGEELPIAREKGYGIIYRQRNTPPAKVVCQVSLATGDLLQATAVSLAGGECQVRLAGNVELKFPVDEIAGLDFSAGRVKYLSQLEPREKKLVPLFDLARDVERDRSALGSPLALGGQTYTRGLGLFPQTRLRYRVAGEYSRFRALAGIDDAAPRLKTTALLRISGDGRALFEGEFAPGEAPRPIDLDLTGVREFEILVDFGSDQLNIGDFLDLADAKLTK
ncbi:MAG: NPCBM/NEW2 domain-containing protein [Planctomycetaceae bacterium]